MIIIDYINYNVLYYIIVINMYGNDDDDKDE